MFKIHKTEIIFTSSLAVRNLCGISINSTKTYTSLFCKNIYTEYNHCKAFQNYTKTGSLDAGRYPEGIT